MRKIWSLFFGMSILALILVACSEPEDQNEPIEDDTIQQDQDINDDENNYNESNDNNEKVNDDNFNGKDEDINDNNNGDKTVNNSDEVEEKIEAGMKSYSIASALQHDSFLSEVMTTLSQSVSLNIDQENIMNIRVPQMNFNYEDTPDDVSDKIGRAHV